MQGATLSYFSANTEIGRFVIPVFELTSTSMAITFESGDRIAFSIMSFATQLSQYSSVIEQISTSPQVAVNLLGSEGSYPLKIQIRSVSDGAATNRVISGWTSPGGETSVYVSEQIEWYSPVQGSQKYVTNPLCIIKPLTGRPWIGFIQLWESFANSVATFSISEPSLGNLGDVVVDYTRNYTQPLNVLNLFTSSTALSDITEDIMGNPWVPPPSDPYSEGGESDTGGGTGNFDGTSVDIDFASLPTLSAVDTGFISLYNPSLAQLQSLANYMWSDLFDLDTFKKLFGDPMQAILGLSIVPGPVPGGSAKVVKVGNISTGISMTKAATQYINVDCGTLNVEEFWGAYLDYEPYTKAEIYLPFIGVHQIAVDDIMNKPVHIMYHIDLLSGGCACEIKCGGSVLYTFIGSCAVSIPVTGSDWTNLINGVLSAASAIGTMVATGGASVPAAAGEIASAAVNSLKPSIEKSGSVAGAGGLLAGKVPVLILTRPRQALPGKQNTFTGYPAFITRSLGALSGYTEVHSIRLSGIDGTESEIDEIEELLKGGVIL